jgi:hypothetical protein
MQTKLMSPGGVELSLKACDGGGVCFLPLCRFRRRHIRRSICCRQACCCWAAAACVRQKVGGSSAVHRRRPGEVGCRRLRAALARGCR